ncbi:MAG: 50S ribosomal protein L28 [Planctomycetes bacterium]|nr:50S ribosomal protein L28 [Planctomycetota bacterium]
MAQCCDSCGKTPAMGNSIVQRGKAKYLGGNGRKTTGITRRQFKPNLQRIRVQEGGSVVRRRVCVQCIRSGRVQKAVVRKPFTIPATTKAG